MHKSFLHILLFGLSFLTVAQTKTTMYTSGRDIYTACGEKVVFRGINEMMIWSNNRTGTTILPEIAKTGANSVRLVWNISGSTTELDQLIDNCIKNNMIPIPELHDATGDFSKFQSCLDYWKKPEVAAVIQKHKKWVIVNIANEVGGGSESDTQYENYYKDAISQLRNAGYDMPLVIDAAGWGNTEKYVVNTCTNLYNSDIKKNLIFSVHTYWAGTNQTTRLDKLISDMKTKNLPLIIGEGPQKAASPSSCTALFPYIYLMDKCQSEGIGWLSWSWGAVDNGDCNAPNSIFDMTTDGKFTGLNDFGKELCTTAASSIKNTSIRPVSLVNSTCITTNVSTELFEQSNTELSVFPNPNEGNFIINGNLSGKWMLYDSLGKFVMEGKSKTIEMGHLDSGIYSLKANDQSLKVIKK